MKRLITYILVMCLLLSVCAYADQSDVNITELRAVQTTNGTTGEISQYVRISGTTTDVLNNKILTIGIIGENLDKSDSSNYEILKQLIVASDGSYSVDIPFGKGGNFIVRVSAQDNDTPVEMTITTASVDVINEFMHGIKYVYDKSQLDSKIMSDGEILGFDMMIYKRLSLQKRESICDEVLSDARMEPIQQIKAAFDASCSVIALSAQNDTDIVLDTLEHYEDLYSFGSDGEFVLFQNGDAELRRYVLQKFGSTTLQTTEDVKSTLYKYTALYDIYDIEMDSQMINKITSHSSYINPTQYSAFNNLNLSQKTNVAGYLNKNKAENMTDFNAKLEYVITNYSILYPQKQNNGTVGDGSRPSSSVGTLPQTPPAAGMIGGSTEITVSFDDLGESKWAEEAILYLLKNKVVNGKTTGKFYPNDNVTRAEFVKMLMLGYGVTSDDGKSKAFSDVPSSHWAHEYVNIASSRGLVNGISETEFGADSYITREDMAVMGYRLLICFSEFIGEQSIENVFADFSSFSDYAKNGILMLNKHGFLNGYPDGSFKPKNNVTRAEAAQFVYNLIKGRG